MSVPVVQRVFEDGVRSHQEGRLDEAARLYGQVLATEPGHLNALHMLGVLEHQRGRNETAAGLIRRAIAIEPASAELHYNLGTVLRAMGRVDEAIGAFQRTTELRPQWAQAQNSLGLALEEAGRLAEAVDAYRRALAGQPGLAAARINLGVALRRLGELAEAITILRQAIDLEPGRPEAHCNLSMALRDNGEVDQAILAAREAVRLRPDDANFHFNLAFSLLLKGEFREGWAEFEYRAGKDKRLGAGPAARLPVWEGRSLTGKRILIHAERGFGDTIQFARFVPLVARMGGRVVLQAHAELTRLLETLDGVEQVVAAGNPLPGFELRCPLLSLARHFVSEQSEIPNRVPYLRCDPMEAAAWRARLARDGSALRVGLVWAGSPAHQNDRSRSIPLKELSALAGVSGLKLYSLQKGPAAAQVREQRNGLKLTDLGGELGDFMSTAAVLENLDLLISADTSVAHLAGALGRPAWVMLPFAPDWRWLLGHTETPWYPTLRLFRQLRPGDWAGVVERIAGELSLERPGPRVASGNT